MTAQRTPSPAVAAQLAAQERRRRTFWASLVVVVVLAAAGIVGYERYNRRPADPVRFPAGIASGDDTGVARGAGGVTIDVYADFMCPDCKRFEEATTELLDDLVTRKRATVVAHPVAFLDRVSNGAEYSTRASAASGCAADGGKFTEYSQALFRHQPAENTAGLPDSRLIDIGKGIGLSTEFATCVEKKTYRGWATHVTEKAVRRGVTGTPTVMINGASIGTDPAKIAAAIDKAA